jgi:hypothetical protein
MGLISESLSDCYEVTITEEIAYKIAEQHVLILSTAELRNIYLNG